MEKDDEIHGATGTSYTTEFRQYDTRLGRWLSVDPMYRSFPWQSPYVAFDNNPIYLSDPSGLASGGPDGINPELDDDSQTSDDVIKPSPTGGKIQNPYPTAGDGRKSVTSLSLSKEGKDFIASWERGPDGGAALTQYDDKNPNGKPDDPVEGYLTIGYGHKILAGEDYSKGITQQEANDLLTSDIEDKAVNPINKLVTAPLLQQEYDALVSYVFNTGSLKGTQLLKNLNDKKYSKAVEEMDINTSDGVFMQGLENRRQAEQNIFKKGVYKNN